jgi:hypothetical protein
MKKSLFILTVCLFSVSILYSQKYFVLPNEGQPAFKVFIPEGLWDVSDADEILSLSPLTQNDNDRLFMMLWASEDPEAEDAVDVITLDAFTIVESLLTDIVWGEEIEEFEINGIDFAAIDGYGYYDAGDGNSELMTTTIMIFIPTMYDVGALVFFGTPDSYDKWEENLLEIIKNISTYK